MATKKTVEVLIDGKLYTLSTEDSGDFVQKIVNYFNGKIMNFKKNPNYRRLTRDYQNVLLSLNIAEDLFNEREKADRLRQELAKKEEDINALRDKYEILEEEYINLKKKKGKNE